MGVVRDVTVDNLVTAVGNIDTSTLAQDSTLQDVVTAIGNISGGSDPVTNTTVNSLCKDTTGQSIASAISGLGTTLGSDRALIDGSNIANPSAFRQNIGLVSETITLTSIITGIFYSRCKKYGNVVDLYVELLNVNNTTLDNIIQLPASILPDHRITFDNLVLNTNGDALKGYGRGQVDPTGYLKYQVLGTYAATFATIHVVYTV